MNLDAVYNQLAVELRGIEAQIRELKQKQFTGTDTVQAYKNEMPGTWDLDWNVSVPFASASRDFIIFFDADTQPAPANSMRYRIFIDNKEYFTTASFDDHPQDVAVLGYVHDSFMAYAQERPKRGRDAWYFNVTGYRDGMNIKVKFTVDSTDTGTVSIREI